MDGSLTSGFVPQTPPSRPLVKNYHRRLDSFPTDDIHEDPEFGIDDESLTTGITASISLGAFPVFLIQESPTREGAGKPGPQFPESPESSYGFQSPPRWTTPRLVHQINDSTLGKEEFRDGSDWDRQDQAQQTPTRAPIRMIHPTPNDQWDQLPISRGVARKSSCAKVGAEFGRRLFQDEDETLVGHYEVTGEKLHPGALRYSSSTSTSLASPLSDTFSPGSTSCSISTSSSHPSPRDPSAGSYDERLEPEGFPTEVGGSASLDLEVAPSYEQAVSNTPATCLELKPLHSEADITIDGLVGDVNSCATSPYVHFCSTLAATGEAAAQHACDQCNAVPYSGTDSADFGTHPELRATTPFQPHTRPGLYGQLGLFEHPHFRLSQLLKVQRNASSSSLSDGRRSVSSPNAHPSASVTSPVSVKRRRAFSGTREFVQDTCTGLDVLDVPGRLRSRSVSSSNQNSTQMKYGSKGLTVQAARSRSNSTSGSIPYTASTGSKTLCSHKSKDSLQSNFANLPEYVAFLREITLELWIDQEGFRAIQPQFKLHRYTPGQLAPARSTQGVGVKNTPAVEKRVSLTSPVRSNIQGSSMPTPTMLPRQPQFSQSGSNQNGCLTTNGSPTIMKFQPQVQVVYSGLGLEPLETPVEPQFLRNWGLAEFTMKKRQGWNFHHGMVDSEPVLRRLTINGVQDRDYLSREAFLSVKSNGVYTVKGTEDRGRFEWKLEYLVEDRRGSSGAVIQGEKTLTPLSFSCAPELLIPEQGKKVKLLHVVKKSMTPKIHSKLDLPVMPTTPRNRGSTSETSTLGHASTGSAGKVLETLVKVARPKSRPATPKHSYPHSHSPLQTPTRDDRQAVPIVAGGTESMDKHSHRRAASYSSMRPDLRKILGVQPEK